MPGQVRTLEDLLILQVEEEEIIVGFEGLVMYLEMVRGTVPGAGIDTLLS